jgi:hypothetical protein
VEEIKPEIREGRMGWVSGSGSSTAFRVKDEYDFIDIFMLKPGLYIGSRSLSKFHAFWAGYVVGIRSVGIELEPEVPCFIGFNEYIEINYNESPSAKGWATIILENEGYNEADALEVFYDHLLRFRNITKEDIKLESL